MKQLIYYNLYPCGLFMQLFDAKYFILAGTGMIAFNVFSLHSLRRKHGKRPTCICILSHAYTNINTYIHLYIYIYVFMYSCGWQHLENSLPCV